MTTQVEGQVVKVGDIVGFKSDIEQSGKIAEIRGPHLLIEALSCEGFDGDYIGGSMYTEESASRCWVEYII